MLRGLFARVGALMRRAPRGPRLTLDDGVVQALARQAPPPRLSNAAGVITARARG